MGIDEKKYSNYIMGRNLLTTKESFVIFPDGLGWKYITDKYTRPNEKEIRLKGTEISELIHKGNYFNYSSTK